MSWKPGTKFPEPKAQVSFSLLYDRGFQVGEVHYLMYTLSLSNHPFLVI